MTRRAVAAFSGAALPDACGMLEVCRVHGTTTPGAIRASRLRTDARR
jgi:hypothetical protein